MPCSSLAVKWENLSLLRPPRLESSRSGRRGGGFQLLVFRLLGETKLAQPRRLERHGLVLALLVELEGRFPLLRLAQKRLGIAPCGGAACRRFAHLLVSSNEGRRARPSRAQARHVGRRRSAGRGTACAAWPVRLPRPAPVGEGARGGEPMLPDRHGRVHQSLDRLEIWPLAVIAE